MGDSSDKSCGVYSRVAFKTVVVVYPETIIWGWLLKRLWLLNNKLQYALIW